MPALPPESLQFRRFVITLADSHLFSHVRQFERSRRLPLLAIAVSLFALWGCSLFPSSASKSTTAFKRPGLPPIQAPPDAIQLEVFFLERPAEDHLLAYGIWKDVDQIGALPAETREILRDNGFRIGHVSSNPPLSVQKLFGQVADFPSNFPEYARPIMGRHQFLSPGVETEIRTGIEHERCDFLLRDGDRTKTLDYDKVSCVLRMKANRLQDGWVRIDFLPEIHYGNTQTRHTPVDEGWAFRTGQSIDVRHAQRFCVTMNVGESALITSTPEDPGTLGDRFFCHDDRGLKKQRVLIVRIVDSGRSASNLER